MLYCNQFLGHDFKKDKSLQNRDLWSRGGALYVFRTIKFDFERVQYRRI